MDRIQPNLAPPDPYLDCVRAEWLNEYTSSPVTYHRSRCARLVYREYWDGVPLVGHYDDLELALRIVGNVVRWRRGELEWGVQYGPNGWAF